MQACLFGRADCWCGGTMIKKKGKDYASQKAHTPYCTAGGVGPGLRNKGKDYASQKAHMPCCTAGAVGP
eukprot:1142057-Pelagomonas_calceolata.AAC.4